MTSGDSESSAKVRGSSIVRVQIRRPSAKLLVYKTNLPLRRIPRRRYSSRDRTMPFELRLLAQEDAQEAAALLVASFKNNPFRGIALPNGMSLDTIDEIVRARQKAVDDPAMYALKVVDTDNNDKMAGCAVWNHVKVMTGKGWERAKEEALKEYPEARHDMLDEFTAKSEEFKRRIMGHTRWLSEFASALHFPSTVKLPYKVWKFPEK